MFSSVDSCIAVATAMTAERSPMCLFSAAGTIVATLASRAGVIGRYDCGPLTAAGISRSLGGSEPPRVPAAPSMTARQELTGWAAAAWCAAAVVGLVAGPDVAALAMPAVATPPPHASAVPRKIMLMARLGRRGLGRSFLLSKDGSFHLFPVARLGSVPWPEGLLALPARHARASLLRERPWDVAKAGVRHCRCARPGS